MKELKAIEPIYLEEFDVHVNPYLTLAQIQKIINAVKIFDTWSEREQNLDLLTLVYATDITPEEIEKIGHESLQASGLIDVVKSRIVNFYKVQEGIDYNESVQRGVNQIVNKLPEIVKPLAPLVNKVVKQGLAESKK